MTSLIVPAALPVKASYCPQRLRLQGYLGWGRRCSGARHLGCLQPFTGQPLPEALKLKASWSPASKPANFVGSSKIRALSQALLQAIPTGLRIFQVLQILSLLDLNQNVESELHVFR